MKRATTLINFHIPNDLKNQFDSYCEALGTSRTRVLLELIQNFIIDNADEVVTRIERQKQLNEMRQRTPRLQRFREFCSNLSNEYENEDDQPPEFFVSRHDE